MALSGPRAPAPPAAVSAEAVAVRLAVVRERIVAAGGDLGAVTIVAVTKGHGPAAAVAAVEAGLDDVGENYAAELLATAAAVTNAVAGLRGPNAVAGLRGPNAATGLRGPNAVAARCHFLGHVQRNKVRAMAGAVHLWQGIDRVTAGQEIARRRPGAAVLVQVNVSGEAARNGCGIDEAPGVVAALADLGLDVRGLMAVGPAGPPESARAGFRAVVAAADRMGLDERSIGMTDDLEVAVEEGSTMVRIGRGLFGPRNSGPDLRR